MFDVAIKGDYVNEIYVDIHGNIQDCSNAFCILLGINKEEVITLYFEKIIKFKRHSKEHSNMQSDGLLEHILSSAKNSCYVTIIGRDFSIDAFCTSLLQYDSNQQAIGFVLLLNPYLNTFSKNATPKQEFVKTNNKEMAIEHYRVVDAFNAQYEQYHKSILETSRDILFSCNFDRLIPTDDIKQKLSNITKDINKIQTINAQLKRYVKDQKVYSIVNITEVMQKSIALLHQFVGQESIEYLKFYSQDLSEHSIYLDEYQVSQAFFYILQNAYEFSAKCTEPYIDINISLQESRSQKQILISIANSGNTIDESKKSLIYMPFYTTKTTTNNDALSLYFAKIILCNNHNMQLRHYNLANKVVFEVLITL